MIMPSSFTGPMSSVVLSPSHVFAFSPSSAVSGTVTGRSRSLRSAPYAPVQGTHLRQQAESPTDQVPIAAAPARSRLHPRAGLETVLSVRHCRMDQAARSGHVDEASPGRYRPGHSIHRLIVHAVSPLSRIIEATSSPPWRECLSVPVHQARNQATHFLTAETDLDLDHAVVELEIVAMILGNRLTAM